MKITTVAIFLLLAITEVAIGQKLPLKQVSEKIKEGKKVTASDFGFTEYTIPMKEDTVNFFTFAKPNSSPTSIYVYLPGTAPESIYSYHKDTDSTFWWSSLTSFDFSFLPDEYLFVIAAKPGYGFVGNGDLTAIPTNYWEKTSLEDRVMRASKAIDYIKRRVIKRPKKIAVFGYSEGFYVGSKLATKNKSITHLGVGGGGGYMDFYDFVLSQRIAIHKGETNLEKGQKSIENTLDNFKKIMSDPSSTKDFSSGYTYKRWASFAQPPVQNLVKLTIPIFMVHGTMDENTPIENAYIVPLEFARLGKQNLTFKTYLNADHSLIERTSDGKEIVHWQDMMIRFFAWIKKN
jgi:pimeloyl-ACP methyl ester carboxylesterase